jgi:C_GCAxxG_C_C family probable redox protein
MLAVGEPLLGQVDDQLRRMMTALAGGVGGSHEEMCGALSAGALLLGALYGRISPDEGDETCYAIASKYRQGFIDEWGTTRCADLRAKGYGSDGTLPCASLVKRAALILLDLLDSRSGGLSSTAD